VVRRGAGARAVPALGTCPVAHVRQWVHVRAGPPRAVFGHTRLSARAPERCLGGRNPSVQGAVSVVQVSACVSIKVCLL